MSTRDEPRIPVQADVTIYEGYAEVARKLAELEAGIRREIRHLSGDLLCGPECVADHLRSLVGGETPGTGERNFAHCTQHSAHDVDCSWCRTAEQDLARALGEGKT